MKASICYVMPANLLRRPIAELLQLQKGRRKLGLLIPRKLGQQRDTSLHYSKRLPQVDIHTYPTVQLPFSSFEWPIPGLRFFREAWQILRTYDIIHIWAHFYLNNLLLLLMSLLFPKKQIILTIDSLPGYSFSSGWAIDTAFKIYTWTVARLVYGIPDIITLYGRGLLPYAKQSGINMKKVRVLPTGIKEVKRVGRKEMERLQKSLGVEKKSVVLFAAILNPRKRGDIVLSVAEEFPKVTFLIAGDGPDRKRLERLKKKKALSNVRLLGWRKDIHALMAISDAFLFPSSGEGLPGVVMEAMMIGRPVLTTKIPCTTDLIRDGKEGSLCPIDDTGCFVKKLERILRNQKEARRLALSAQKRIRTEFSWKRLLKKYEELYS